MRLSAGSLLVTLMAGVALPPLLAGCGADVAMTAGTASKLQAEQGQQAQAKQAQFKKQLGAALQAPEHAASAAGEK